MSFSDDSQPGFFEVLSLPRAYSTLLYLMLSMATGIFTFTFVITGLSLSLGLAILIIGLPIALLFLAGSRLLSVAELHLLKALVGGDDMSTPGFVPPGTGWLARLKSLAGDLHTWTGLLYFVLLMPLGTVYFTLMTTLFSTGLAFLLVPVARVLQVKGYFDPGLDFTLHGLGWIHTNPNQIALLCGLVGIVLIPLTFHLALLLGRFQMWLARHLLVRA